MKILLTGSNGQVGLHLQQTLAPMGELIKTDRSTLNLHDKERITNYIRSVKPDIIVNSAAYTQVDNAEENPKTVYEVNSEAPQVIAKACKEQDILLVHYSTDYIFDGKKNSPYVEEDAANPVNVYGKSKLLGEKGIIESGCRHLIFRISWVFSKKGRNFLTFMLEAAKKGDRLKLSDDQIGSPTSAQTVADVTAQILKNKNIPYGIYHLAGLGEASRFDLTKEIFKYVPSPTVEPVASTTFSARAPRPMYTPLNSNKFQETFNIQLPTWQEMVEELMISSSQISPDKIS